VVHVKKFSEEDKTDWLPGTLAPERDGVYERRYDQGDTVANVARFVPKLAHLPHYVTQGERGAGFAEVAAVVLAAR
jgi:hypothetical protein